MIFGFIHLVQTKTEEIRTIVYFWNGWLRHGSGLTESSANYCSLQFTYRAGHSVETVLIKVTDAEDILQVVDSGSSVALIGLDI